MVYAVALACGHTPFKIVVIDRWLPLTIHMSDRRRKRSAARSLQNKAIKLEADEGPSAGTHLALLAPGLPIEQAAASLHLPGALQPTPVPGSDGPVVHNSNPTAAASSDALQLQAGSLPCQSMATLLGAEPSLGTGCSGWSSLMAEACSLTPSISTPQPALPGHKACVEKQQLPRQQDCQQLLPQEQQQQQHRQQMTSNGSASVVRPEQLPQQKQQLLGQEQQVASNESTSGVRPEAASIGLPLSTVWAAVDSIPGLQHHQSACDQQHLQGDHGPSSQLLSQQHGQQELWQQYQGQQHITVEPSQTSSFDLAMNLLGPAATRSAQQIPQQQAWTMAPGASSSMPLTYHPHHFVSRLSLKLFNCTPADLPDDLRAQLTGWLKCAPAGAEGYMRPGCVHLTLDALLESAGTIAGMFEVYSLGCEDD